MLAIVVDQTNGVEAGGRTSLRQIDDRRAEKGTKYTALLIGLTSGCQVEKQEDVAYVADGKGTPSHVLNG